MYLLSYLFSVNEHGSLHNEIQKHFKGEATYVHPEVRLVQVHFVI